ncbi:MAG: polysaccharide deacetylase family protein [Chitinophagales bacterium]|nr:polysaccharide deacetylase family protein [Chitinophagales bacterium]
MLLIYSPKDSARLQYVLQLFFNELIKTEYHFTTDQNEFLSSPLPKLNYSKKKFGNHFFLFAHDLLFEKEISKQEISVGEYKRIKTIFAHAELSAIPFDPLAAAFYLASRYEEYLPFKSDEHGRFPDKESLNYKEKFHEVPVINHYAIFIKEILLQHYPQLSFLQPSFQFQLTYDIDFAFAYRNKGLLRTLGGFAKSLFKLSAKEITGRTNVLLGVKKDPFNTFYFQNALHKKFNLKAIYFFLLGDYGKFDKNILFTNKELRALINRISQINETGIHCSYVSNSFPEKIKTEKARLEKIIGKNIFRNRQHFLKLSFPFTYQNLLAAAITEDYTMGYASLIGFRAGIASPFFWYNLAKEETTSLRIFPLAVMDASLFYYQKLNAADAFLKSKQLIDEVKKVNGYFQFLAHNDLLSEENEWKGWREKFEALLALSS